MKICSVLNCGKPHCALGYCIAHHSKFKRYGDPLAKYIKNVRYCSVIDCKNIHFSRGYCSLHYNKMIRNNNPPCKIEGCNQPRVGNGFCSKHYQRSKYNPNPEKSLINISPPLTCTIDGCTKPYMANGMCNTHYMKVYTTEKRKKVINHYTSGNNSCQCCGESEYIFLTVDHMNDDGAEQRRQGISSGNELIDWLIKNNFPEGYQILCQNCNTGRFRNGGICPHKVISAPSNT